VLGVLLVMYTFNYLDRYVLSILVEPIKRDLGTSDTMMGFLIGPAFAIFYTALGVPIARLADRRSRRTILAAGFALWSAVTALSGLVRNGAELTLARIGVGIGEAAGTAPAHSLISDYFPLSARARALAVFQLGVTFGSLLGLVIGGLLVEPLGWRWTFVAVGAPGLLFALLLRLTVREPLRGGLDPTPPQRAPAAAQPGAIAALRALWQLPSYRMLAFGGGLASFAGTGFGAWVPTYFVRVHGMSYAEVGLQYGLTNTGAAFVGALLAGWLADRLGSADPRWTLRVPALGVALCLPFLCLICTHPDPRIAILFSIPSGLTGAGWAPCCYTAAQNLAPPAMRSVAASLLILFITLLGQGAGPWAVGALSDALAPAYGVISLRIALVAVLLASLVGAGLLAVAARRYPADLARAALHRTA
jgi:MFS family permease